MTPKWPQMTSGTFTTAIWLADIHLILIGSKIGKRTPIFVQSERGISLSLHWHQLFSFLPILRVINLCPRRITLETFIFVRLRVFCKFQSFFIFFALLRFLTKKLIQIKSKLLSAISAQFKISSVVLCFLIFGKKFCN